MSDFTLRKSTVMNLRVTKIFILRECNSTPGIIVWLFQKIIVQKPSNFHPSSGISNHYKNYTIHIHIVEWTSDEFYIMHTNEQLLRALRAQPCVRSQKKTISCILFNGWATWATCMHSSGISSHYKNYTIHLHIVE